MRSRHLVLLGLLALTACSRNGALQSTDGPVASPDTSADTAKACDAKVALRCTEAFLIEGATVYCGDADYPSVCEDGVARCPYGMVDRNRCTCYGPGSPACRCPALGRQCNPSNPDGDVDQVVHTPSPVDVRSEDGDSGDDGRYSGPCGHLPLDGCARRIASFGDAVVCDSTVHVPSACVNGAWACTGSMDVAYDDCTCWTGRHVPGCDVCTPNGWRCPDGGLADGGDAF